MRTDFVTPSDHIYSAVVFLRRQGHTVYRRGNHHRMDGCAVTSRDLLTRAFTEGWPVAARVSKFLGRLSEKDTLQ